MRSVLTISFGFAQLPVYAAAQPIPFAAACPSAAAFQKREQAREAALRSHSETPPTQPALRDELKEMVRHDQEARNAFFGSPGLSTHAKLTTTEAANLVRLKTTDAANLAGLKRIVAQFGFPTLAMVGRDGVENVWLLTQHADTDVVFQKEILAILQAQAGKVVPPGEIAMLSDRVRIHEGKPQVYGSNFDIKTMEPTPIEDPAHVDERRAEVHLMPMADYRCMMKQMYRAAK